MGPRRSLPEVRHAVCAAGPARRGRRFGTALVLGVDERRSFRLAGLHPGTELDRFALAALTVGTPGRADGMLESLTRASLIQRAQPGRYGLHDLLRAYARELVTAEDPDSEPAAALTRPARRTTDTSRPARTMAWPGPTSRPASRVRPASTGSTPWPSSPAWAHPRRIRSALNSPRRWSSRAVGRPAPGERSRGYRGRAAQVMLRPV